MKIDNQNKTFTVKEVAEKINVHLVTVYRMVKEKELPSFRIGAKRGGIRIREADLNFWIKTQINSWMDKQQEDKEEKNENKNKS